MRIRKIRVTDIENLFSLDQSCFSKDIAYSKHTFHSILSYPNSSGLLVEKGSIVIAFILVHWTDRAAEMITIDVSSEFRRKGIGTRLLHLTEGELQKRGIVSEYLHVSTDNDPALSFYRKEGFRLQRRVPCYYSPDQDAYLMVKLLGQRKCGAEEVLKTFFF